MLCLFSELKHGLSTVSDFPQSTVVTFRLCSLSILSIFLTATKTNKISVEEHAIHFKQKVTYYLNFLF